MRYSVPVLSATSATASFNGPSIDATSMYRCSVQLSASGALTGAASLQASNDDHDLRPTEVKNWSVVPATTVPVSGAGVYLIPSTELSYVWVRVAFSASSGSAGTATADMKSVGF